MTTGPMEDSPDAYEAPNGVEAAMPGQPDDPGSRDPSSTTVAGAVTNALAQSAEHESDTHGLGSRIGDPVDLPPAH